MSTGNSIRVEDGGPRTDPEGSAPAARNVKLVTWEDANGLERTMTLGAYLYEYDFSFSDNNQVIQRSANDDAYGHPGFGYVVSHTDQNGNSPLGKRNAPTAISTSVFAGAHHAIHRVELLYDRDKEGGGLGIKIPVVIEWFVATGRDHPVWSVTWKTGEAINPSNVSFDVYRMDVRGPYGSLNFDGAATRNAGDAVGGVAWGDSGFLFTTSDGGDLTLNSTWRYEAPNSVNFVRAWTTNENAEMGIVQTRPWDSEMGYGDRVVGRERGVTSDFAFLDKGDCTGFGDNRNYRLPCINGWPYQLMNYDWDTGAGKPVDEATGTKLLGWGSPYGWLGSSNFDLFDYRGTADGRGDRSYAMFIVLGPKYRYDPTSGMPDADGDVALTLRAVEALASATIRDAGPGAVVTQVPRGPGAGQTKTIASGYNDTYAAYFLRASDGKVKFTIAPYAGQPVDNPIFVIENYGGTTLPQVRVGGAEVGVNTGDAGSGAFVSVDAAGNRLWVTLNRTVSDAIVIEVSR